MQQLITHAKLSELQKLTNAVLMEGWKVVPGTMYVGTTYSPARKTTPAEFRLPDGRQIHQIYGIVVENPDAR